ncbi:hypothetical protein B9Z19DRAFT_1072805 [Tuber borchii]|uniref:Uncharacterized protein n=1 Tax=Tuber borchii TaxID=42251 RepID=A0A2T7A6M5_TUBBO|nr:hypothetical protein B9Z19DRAFT_1072805 [Tuber borchii]
MSYSLLASFSQPSLYLALSFTSCPVLSAGVNISLRIPIYCSAFLPSSICFLSPLLCSVMLIPGREFAGCDITYDCGVRNGCELLDGLWWLYFFSFLLFEGEWRVLYLLL